MGRWTSKEQQDWNVHCVVFFSLTQTVISIETRWSCSLICVFPRRKRIDENNAKEKHNWSWFGFHLIFDFFVIFMFAGNFLPFLNWICRRKHVCDNCDCPAFTHKRFLQKEYWHDALWIVIMPGNETLENPMKIPKTHQEHQEPDKFSWRIFPARNLHS